MPADHAGWVAGGVNRTMRVIKICDQHLGGLFLAGPKPAHDPAASARWWHNAGRDCHGTLDVSTFLSPAGAPGEGEWPGALRPTGRGLRDAAAGEGARPRGQSPTDTAGGLRRTVQVMGARSKDERNLRNDPMAAG